MSFISLEIGIALLRPLHDGWRGRSSRLPALGFNFKPCCHAITASFPIIDQTADKMLAGTADWPETKAADPAGTVHSF